LFDHPRAQTIDLLIHRLFNLRQRRLWVHYSPLRHDGKHVLALFFPPFLEVFGLHLALLSSWLGTTPFLFASLSRFATSLPSLLSKHTAQKSATHPTVRYELTFSNVNCILEDKAR
jgi:hypothetical protein